MSTRFVVIVSLGIIVLHQAGTAILLGGLGRPREAVLVAGVLFLLYPLWRIARSTGHATQVLRAGRAPMAAYPIALLALVSAMPLALALGGIVAEVPTPIEDLIGHLLRAETARDWVITLLAAAVVPALGEELLFRGFLQRGLEARLGPVAAIAISSVAFGAIHGPGRALPAALLGGLLGWIAWRTRSVWPGIVAHLLSNAVIVVAVNVEGAVSVDAWEAEPGWAEAIGGAVVAAALLAVLARVSSPVDADVDADVGGAEALSTEPRDPE